MRFAFLIAWREFAESAKTKGFWLGLLLFPLIIMASIQLPILLEKKGTPTRHFVLVDASGEVETLLVDALDREQARRVLSELRDYAGRHLRDSAGGTNWLREFADASDRRVDEFRSRGGSEWLLAQLGPGLRSNAPPFVPPSPRFLRAPLPEGVDPQAPTEEIAEQLRPWLTGNRRILVNGRSVEVFAAILIPSDWRATESAASSPGASSPGSRGVQYWSGNLADMALLDSVERALNSELRRREYEARGIDPNTIRAIERTRATVTSLNPRKAAGEETVGLADRLRQWLPSAFVYLLWVAIWAIAQMLLTSVIEEKSNRIIEVLLSSVTPGELMAGKLLGIASIGLAMIAVWIASLVAVVLWKAAGITPAQAAAGAGAAAQLPTDIATILRTTWLLPAFLVYFLLGYLFYAGVILALGSTCNTLKEAQNYMGVIIVILMIPLLAMAYIPRDPNGPIAVALSWFPPYTPFVMMNRVTADPPLRDVIGTMLLLLASTGVVLWAAGKIFRIGVLRTGQPPRFLELIRWLRSS